MIKSSLQVRVFVGALVGLFISALVGLVVVLIAQPAFGDVGGLVTGLGVWLVMVAAVMVLAYLFRPRDSTKPGTQVFLAALSAMSAAFMLVAGGKSVWESIVDRLVGILRSVGIDMPQKAAEDNRFYFSVFSATVLGICGVAWLLHRTTSTVPPPAVMGTPPKGGVEVSPSWNRLLIESLLLPIAALLFMLALENQRDLCHSALSLHTSVSDSSPASLVSAIPLNRLERVGLAVISAAMFAGTIYILLAIRVWWIRRDRATREEYAMFASWANICLVLALTLSLLFSPSLGRTPWAAVTGFAQIAFGRTPAWLPERWTDTALAFVLCLLACFILRYLFVSWTGMKSVDQFRQEQRREKPRLLSEGFQTWKRLLVERVPPKVYIEPDRSQEFRQLEGATDPLAWKERARELVRLKTSSYSFGAEAAWHDQAQCWVGLNLDTNKRVLLFVAHDNAGPEELKQQLTHVDEVAQLRGAVIGEIIVATPTPVAEPAQATWNDVNIQWKSEEDLLNTLIDPRDYLYAIRKRVTVDHLPDSELTIEQVYVQSEVDLPNGAGRSSVEKLLDDWVADPGRKQLALLGEYGQGKSTSALMWVHRRIQAWKPPSRLPLLIELRGTSPRDLTPEGLLGAWAVQHNFNARALLRLVVAGRIVLIFEGFDEMSLVGDAEMRLRHFRTLWQFAFPRAKILFTGRPNFFLDDQELKLALGIVTQVGDNPYCEAVRLVPFDSGRIAQALRSHPREVGQQILDRAEMNERFLELVSRPSLLHVVATLWVRERLFEKDLNDLTSAYVMDLFVRHSYRRQRDKVMDFATYAPILTQDERAYFMAGIAAYMAANDLPNQITAHQLWDAFDRLLEAIPDSVSTGATAAGEAARPLKQRVAGSEYIREGVLTDVRACGLLVDDPAALGTFRFAHKSFMEFLFADVLAERVLRPDSESASAICSATGAEVSLVFRQTVALQFLGELLAGQIRSKQSRPENIAQTNYKIANQLFAALVTTWRNPIARVRAFTTFALSMIGQGRILRGSSPYRLRQLMTLVTLSIVAMPLMFISLYVLLQSSINSTSDYLPSWSLRVLFMLLCVVIVLAVQDFFFYQSADEKWRRRLVIWKTVCNQIAIPDGILHRVVGTNWLAWQKATKFRLLWPREWLTVYRLTEELAEHHRGLGTEADLDEMRRKELMGRLIDLTDLWYTRMAMQSGKSLEGSKDSLYAFLVERFRH